MGNGQFLNISGQKVTGTPVWDFLGPPGITYNSTWKLSRPEKRDDQKNNVTDRNACSFSSNPSLIPVLVNATPEILFTVYIDTIIIPYSGTSI